MNKLNKMNRELVYSTLFELLKNIPGFNSYSRRLKHWDDVAYPDMPVLFLVQGKETANTTSGMTTKWTFNADIYIYVNAGENHDESPYSILNPLIDKVIELFDADTNWVTQGKQNLGGLIHNVKISGEVMNDGGNLGPIAVAIIPLEIMVVA